MKTLTLIQPETFLKHEMYNYYLAISVDTLVVIEQNEYSFVALEHIIVGKDTDFSICEFECLDDMLDVINFVKSEISIFGYVYLENHFNINL